jgi:hypothetical protein
LLQSRARLTVSGSTIFPPPLHSSPTLAMLVTSATSFTLLSSLSPLPPSAPHHEPSISESAAGSSSGAASDVGATRRGDLSRCLRLAFSSRYFSSR